MTKELKDRLLHEALCAEEVMRYLWRAYFAAKYDNTENCLGILDALRCTTGSQRWAKLMDEVRKEQEDNRMVNIFPPTDGNIRSPYYPQTTEEKIRFMPEAFGIPDETDGKETEK